MSGYAHLNAPEGTAHNQMMCFVVIPLLIRKTQNQSGQPTAVHATAAAAARRLPGVCTFALQPTKQRQNANWSRIAQLTRSGQVGFGFAKVRVILGHFLAVSENSEPRGAGPAASEAVWTAERTNIFNKLYLQTDSRLLPQRRRGRTRTPRCTRCRSVARSHLIPVYRPPSASNSAVQ